jgi:hypothetical protein
MFSRISGVKGFRTYSCDMAQIQTANGLGRKEKETDILPCPEYF